MLTEKTFKAFAWHQVPIFVATLGHVDLVRGLGFDLFEDIIDHSYETCDDAYLYRMKIFLQLAKFLKKYPTVDDWNKLRKDIWPRLVANHELLIKLKSEKILDPWPYYS